TDLAEFEQALRSAARAASHTERAQHLSAAVELHRGPLLPEYYAEWALAEQERVAALYLQAVVRLLGHLEAAGDLTAALDLSHRAVAANPVGEEAHRELIRLYLKAGQPGEALRQYRELQRILEEELGAAPSAAARALLRQIEARSAGGVGTVEGKK